MLSWFPSMACHVSSLVGGGRVDGWMDGAVDPFQAYRRLHVLVSHVEVVIVRSPSARGQICRHGCHHREPASADTGTCFCDHVRCGRDDSATEHRADLVETKICTPDDSWGIQVAR